MEESRVKFGLRDCATDDERSLNDSDQDSAEFSDTDSDVQETSGAYRNGHLEGAAAESRRGRGPDRVPDDIRQDSRDVAREESDRWCDWGESNGKDGSVGGERDPGDEADGGEGGGRGPPGRRGGPKGTFVKKPYDVPTSGSFYLHDDRWEERPMNRDRLSRDRRREPKWKHDKFEESETVRRGPPGGKGGRKHPPTRSYQGRGRPPQDEEGEAPPSRFERRYSKRAPERPRGRRPRFEQGNVDPPLDDNEGDFEDDGPPPHSAKGGYRSKRGTTAAIRRRVRVRVRVPGRSSSHPRDDPSRPSKREPTIRGGEATQTGPGRRYLGNEEQQGRGRGRGRGQGRGRAVYRRVSRSESGDHFGSFDMRDIPESPGGGFSETGRGGGGRRRGGSGPRGGSRGGHRRGASFSETGSSWGSGHRRVSSYSDDRRGGGGSSFGSGSERRGGGGRGYGGRSDRTRGRSFSEERRDGRGRGFRRDRRGRSYGGGEILEISWGTYGDERRAAAAVVGGQSEEGDQRGSVGGSGPGPGLRISGRGDRPRRNLEPPGREGPPPGRGNPMLPPSGSGSGSGFGGGSSGSAQGMRERPGHRATRSMSAASSTSPKSKLNPFAPPFKAMNPNAQPFVPSGQNAEPASQPPAGGVYPPPHQGGGVPSPPLSWWQAQGMMQVANGPLM